MKVRTIPKRWLAVALVAFLAVAVSSAALAAEFSDDETYRLAEGEIVDDDLYIGAAEIYIDGTVRGDLLAGAAYIEIGPTGVVEGDLWASAGSIVIKGTVQDDLRAAGGGIELSGAVGDDAFLVAGGGPAAAFPTGIGARSIEPGLRISGEIGGDAFVAAGGADITGAVGGDFSGSLGTLDLTGAIGGDVDIQAGELRVDDAARIGGALRYNTPEQRVFPAGLARDIQFVGQAENRGFAGAIAGALLDWILRTVAIVVGVAIVAWLLIRFAPNGLTRPVAAMRAKPLETGLYGLLAAVLLIFIPIASILLAAFIWTFWGAFYGIVMFVFLFASSALVWFLSPLLTGLWLGEIIGERWGGERGPLVLLLMGALLIVILGRIPVLGWVVSLLSFVLALGGLLRSGTGAADASPAETAAG